MQKFETTPSLQFQGKCSRGQVIVLATIALVVLLGSLALATDAGFLWNRKRQMQTAADAAAVAAASALMNANNVCAANVTDSALNIASLNGFTNGVNDVTVTPYCPPADGAYAGQAGYVQVVVQQAVPTYFMRVFGINPVNVAARAVSSNISSQNCVVVLHPTLAGALTISGTSTAVNATCNVIVDSNSSSALQMKGGATLTATGVGVVGQATGGGITPPPQTNVAPAPDPLAFLSPPGGTPCSSSGCSIGGSSGTASVSNCSGATVNASKTVVTLYPGTYCSNGGSPAISDNSSATVEFSPGTYILDGGGLKANGGASLSGTGVTFYLTQDSTHPYGGLSINGGASLNLSAPTSGPLKAILFFQDRSVPPGSQVSTISGGAGSTITGALYFPTTELDYSGGSATGAYTIFVAYVLKLSGGSNFNVNSDYSSLGGGSPIRKSIIDE